MDQQPHRVEVEEAVHLRAAYDPPRPGHRAGGEHAGDGEEERHAQRQQLLGQGAPGPRDRRRHPPVDPQVVLHDDVPEHHEQDAHALGHVGPEHAFRALAALAALAARGPRLPRGPARVSGAGGWPPAVRSAGTVRRGRLIRVRPLLFRDIACFFRDTAGTGRAHGEGTSGGRARDGRAHRPPCAVQMSVPPGPRIRGRSAVHRVCIGPEAAHRLGSHGSHGSRGSLRSLRGLEGGAWRPRRRPRRWPG